MSRIGRKVLIAGITFLIIIVIWHAYVTLFQVPEQILPAPLDYAGNFLHVMQTTDMGRHIGVTLYEIFIGFVIGVVLGLLLGYVCAKSVFLERFFNPYVVLMQVTPKISLAPLFVLWFGLGAESKISLVILVVSFPIMVNTIVGLRSLESNMKDLLKIVGANPWQRFRNVEIPFSLPSIMSGVKASTTYAITGAVIGEMIGANAGLGYLVILGSETYNINLILTAVILLSVIGLLMYMFVDRVERKLLHWHESQDMIV